MSFFAGEFFIANWMTIAAKEMDSDKNTRKSLICKFDFMLRFGIMLSLRDGLLVAIHCWVTMAKRQEPDWPSAGDPALVVY